jgi:serine phosphatase RsbU (regulator of sigma subunit)
MNKAGEEFGVERLQDLLFSSREENLGKVGNILLNRLEEWMGDNHFEDDISMLAIEIGHAET